MSRAFVKEQDDVPEDLPERPVSSNPNFVTARGLSLIDAEIEACRKLLAQGQHDAGQGGHRPGLARSPLLDPAALHAPSWWRAAGKPEVVGFATRVTIERDDGRRQVFAIVGEDEADPAKGLIAYTSPMARALMGKGVGEFAEAPGGEVEIVKLEPTA